MLLNHVVIEGRRSNEDRLILDALHPLFLVDAGTDVDLAGNGVLSKAGKHLHVLLERTIGE